MSHTMCSTCKYVLYVSILILRYGQIQQWTVCSRASLSLASTLPADVDIGEQSSIGIV